MSLFTWWGSIDNSLCRLLCRQYGTNKRKCNYIQVGYNYFRRKFCCAMARRELFVLNPAPGKEESCHPTLNSSYSLYIIPQITYAFLLEQWNTIIEPTTVTTLFTASIAAPLSNNSRTTATWPLSQAKWRGVRPFYHTSSIHHNNYMAGMLKHQRYHVLVHDLSNDPQMANNIKWHIDSMRYFITYCYRYMNQVTMKSIDRQCSLILRKH
jgi:hypothetical protein